MIQDEQGLLKELQSACLKEMEDYLGSFQEVLATLKEDPVACIQELQKVIHSMKGNLQAASFLQFGSYVHALEGILGNFEQKIASIGQTLPDSDHMVLEFFLSGVLDAMNSYLNELKKTGSDSEELKAKRNEPLQTLAGWEPSLPPTPSATEPAEADARPQAAPEIQVPFDELAVITEQSLKADAPPKAEAPAQTPVEAPATRKETAANAGSGLFLLFQNSRQYFAIAIEHVVEVIKTQPLSAPPHPRNDLFGLLNLRGEVLPILNIREIVTDPNPRPAYVVVSQVQDLRFGFQVEAVHQVISLDPSSFQKADGISSFTGGGAISHFCQMDDKTISIFELADVVAA